MADGNEREPDGPPRLKTYARPTLTDYGSVTKLTMAKGFTVVEAGGQQKQSCL
jgi:hypothetical protein